MPGSVKVVPNRTHDAQQNDDVRDKRDVCRETGNPIIREHEQGNKNDGGDGCANAAADGIFAERRVNVAGINDFERRAQRILQNVGEFKRFFFRVTAGDLAVAAFNRALNVGRGIPTRHPKQWPSLCPMFSRVTSAESFSAIVIQRKINLRLAQISAHDSRVFHDVAGQTILRLFLYHIFFNLRRTVRLLARCA